jgi:hypothetical protein
VWSIKIGVARNYQKKNDFQKFSGGVPHILG